MIRVKGQEARYGYVDITFQRVEEVITFMASRDLISLGVTNIEQDWVVWGKMG